MKKVKYIATMVIELEVQENEEKMYYPNGLNEQALIDEMESDTFPELFGNEVKSFHAEGFIIENDEVVARHKGKIFGD